MATQPNNHKSAIPKTKDAGAKPTTTSTKPTILPKEDLGRWESEGGAPMGGRNPTAIKEGQGDGGKPTRQDQRDSANGTRQRWRSNGR